MPKQDHFGLFKRNVKGTDVYYYWFFREDGTRAQLSTGEKTKAKATEYILQKLKEGTINISGFKHGESLSDFSRPFWNEDTCPIFQSKLKRGKRLSKQYLLECRIVLKNHILPHLGSYSLLELTPATIDSWIINLPAIDMISNSRANFCFVVLKQMLDVAVSENVIKNNPCNNVRRLYNNCNKRGCFTTNEVTALLKEPWKEKYSYAACLLSATTGMRLGEIRALTRDRIKDDHIIVDRSWNDHQGFKSTKSGKIRLVPLHPQVKEIIENVSAFDLLFSHNGSFPIDPRRISKPLVSHMKVSSIDFENEHLCFHSFRHFFNTRLVAYGVDGEIVRAAIGHESEKMTDHYLHLTPSDMHQISSVQTEILKKII